MRWFHVTCHAPSEPQNTNTQTHNMDETTLLYKFHQNHPNWGPIVRGYSTQITQINDAFHIKTLTWLPDFWVNENGQLHREDGPAIEGDFEHPDQYYLDGKLYTRKPDWENELNRRELEKWRALGSFDKVARLVDLVGLDAEIDDLLGKGEILRF